MPLGMRTHESTLDWGQGEGKNEEWERVGVGMEGEWG